MKFPRIIVYRRTGWLGRIGLLLILCSLLFATIGCGEWTSEASSIISLLGPAITALAGILSAFGIGIPPTVMQEIQLWSSEAVATLTNIVKPLIDQYKAANDAAKPGLLNEIDAALQTTLANLKNILPAVHVTNPDTQTKVTSIIGMVLSEVEALIALVPALQGKVTSHARLKALMLDLKTPDEFRKDFNAHAATFGDQYTI